MSRNYDNFADLITFSRASTATFVGSNGLIQSATTNTPRIDFDAVTGDRKGLLIEEARTNELDESQDFTDSFWGSTNLTVTANDATGPDGQTSASSAVPTAVSGVHLIQASSTISATTHTDSVFVKADGYSKFGIREGSVSGAYATFDLSSGAVVETGSGASSASIVDYGDGWYRCSMTSVTGTAYGTRYYVMDDSYSSGSPGSYTFTGDGTSGIYVYGAQLEEGAFPTSYIPTSGSTVTRSADVASIATSAFGFNEDEGTFFAEGATFDGAGNAKAVFFADKTGGVFTDRVWLYASVSEAMKFEIEDNNVSQATIVTGSVSLDTFAKFAGSYQENNSAFSNAGGSPNTDTSCTIPKLDTLTIGSYSNSTNFWNGHIKKLQYFPRRLSDTELQEITS